MFRSTSVRARLALAACTLPGCTANAPLAPELARSSPVFGVEAFFEGGTRGDGTVKVITKDAETLRVEGRGRIEPDGTLILDQQVTRGARAAEKRQWRIRPAGPGRFTGMLTDATDVVVGDVQGNRLHLRYPMKGGLVAEQWLYLQPDGRAALNRMAIRKFGVTVARIDETIRKVD